MGDSVITSNQNLVKEERQQKDEQDSASAVQSLVSVGNNNNNNNSSNNNNNKKTGTTDFSVAALLPRNTKVCQSTGKHSAATMEISESSLACGSGELQPAEFQFNQCHLAGSSELMARHRENNHRSGSDQGDLGDAELGRGDGTSEDDTSLDNGFYLGEEAVAAASAAAATAAASGTSSASAGVAYVCPHCGLAAGSLSLLESHILTHGGAAAAAAASAEEDSRLSIDCSSSVGGGGGGVGGSGSSQPSSSRKYRCSQCSATFNWHGDLSQHLQASHGIDRGSKKPDSHGLYRCSHCSYQAKYQSELSRHNRLHLGVKPFACHFCAYNSAWKGDLKRHLEAHHRREIADDKTLSEIMANYKNNAGTRAARSTASQEELASRSLNDIDESSSSLLAGQNSPAVPQPLQQQQPETPIFPCSVCSFVCQSVADLRSHLATHNGSRPYRCSACGKRFHLSWESEKHIRREHCDSVRAYTAVAETGARAQVAPESALLPALCGLCGWRGGGDWEMASRPFRCSVCGHRSNWKWDINKHIKVAHPERGDACTETMSSAEAEATIESYMRDVKGKVKDELAEAGDGYNRPFRCSACGHRSNWKWDVRKHIRQAHSNQPDAFVETLSNEDAKRTLDEYMTSRKCNASVANSGAVCGVAASAATATDATDADMDDAS
uniref:Zinc finger protein 646 n=1 Tax=Macrostomum lignano TaxID=282301 RepID=A0A1I8GC63_9PLAT